jgi:hypothetical protein
MEPKTRAPLTDEDIKTVWPQGGTAAAQLQDADETDTTDAGDSDGTDAGDQDGTDAGGGDTDSTDA